MADHVERFDLAGASVTVVDDGVVAFSKGYGHADVDGGVPVEADATMFPSASVSKLFTWTAVMQLVEAGALDLDADVNDHLTEVQVPDTFPQPVRVWHLLSHTAGFEDKPVVGAFTRDPETLPNLESALVRFMPERLWEPGTYTAYSNYSTALAAHLVAEVSGMSWEQYLEQNVFEPLGMTRTSARQPVPAHLAPAVSKVYDASTGELVESDWEFSVLAPAGGIVTTSRDMGRFMLAHLQGGRVGDTRILEEDTVRAMHQQLFTHDERLSGNAHGFWESEEHSERILSHPGDLNTAHTLLALVPGRDLGLYVAYNSTGGAEARAELWAAFSEDALGPESSATGDRAVGTSEPIDHLAGSYGVNRISTTTIAKLFKLLSVLTVTVDGDALLTEAPGVEPQRWAPEGDNEFAEIGGSGRMVFGEDDAGDVTHVAFDGSPMTSYSPLIAFLPVAWFDSPALHAGVLGASLLLIVSALVIWPALALVRGRRTPDVDRGAARARLWAGGTGILFLLFFLALVLVLLDMHEAEYGLPVLLMVALSVGLLAAVGSLGVAVHAALAWRHGYWRLGGRLHFTFVTFAFAALVWQLFHWNLLGFHV